MADDTELHLPKDLPYPVTVVQLHVRPGESIQQGTRLLTYSFFTPDPDNKEARPTELVGTWDSPIEGALSRWAVREGDNVSRDRARQRPALYASEPCKHGIQMGGLCALCGKDMTRSDHTGFTDASRATIQMNHTANGPTVSFEVAQRLEREAAEHLVKHRKLSLIVDLDQTIVHATVDPTVGDDEGGEEDEANPNWEALKDVKCFRLVHEMSGAPSSRGKGKEKAVDLGCLYYVKPRPGLQEFLTSVATMYEMHVYTMGTRAYAEEVCAAIDPDRKFFGGRLLSRDETGNMMQKSLERLFPVDTSMVVIIDDRADVWGWSANLLKVIPYDFFVGIGDINSAFLPKIDPSSAIMSSATPPPTTPEDEPPSASSSPASTTDPHSPASTTILSVTDESVLVKQNEAALEAQVEERPLAKLQEELTESMPAEQPASVESNEASAAPRMKSPQPKPARKALLKNDDTELQRVKKLLDQVHRQYYEAYDKRPPGIESSKRAGKRRASTAVQYNTTLIVPRMRSATLADVHILFSSVIPLDMHPETSEMWRLAQAFGATCYTELVPEITHLVAAKRGTQKVDAARKRRGVKVVWLQWFTESIAKWERQDETPYLIDGPASAPDTAASSPIMGADQISSDPEPDADDWDTGVVAEPVASVDLSEVAWDDVNAELEEFLAEGDSDDDDEDMVSVKGNEENTDESGSIVGGSAPSTPKTRRKRLRSMTPSEAGLNINIPDDLLRSPLAKRKKIAADRVSSPLKESAVAESAGSREGSPASWEGDEDSRMGDEDEVGTEGEDFDFLAGELEDEGDDEEDEGEFEEG
ncbi:hypothetical protein K488DRAFT_64041 [Vararia minispora EC-137]|uniref:Uncharacterized protein n=1 Tax=Vararia minispora EC-137 TaxID=1314806 RepID=A0ACB8Q5D2_9AGAM|nr:hypothetical protein K488DRAFT_64041 [Vararia minispora EC-137]